MNCAEKIFLSAIVLAGGKSSRMGTDKALLKINQKTFLQKTCEVAADCGAIPIFIVSPWTERYESLFLPTQCRFIRENQNFQNQGPLSGFAQGLTFYQSLSYLETNLNPNFKNSWILLLACDLANLSSAVVKSWCQELPNLSAEVDAYLPRHQPASKTKKWEPLCGFYRSSCLESLNASLQKKEYSFQAWLNSGFSKSAIAEIENADPKLLFNCNTPSEFELLEND